MRQRGKISKARLSIVGPGTESPPSPTVPAQLNEAGLALIG